MEEIVGEIVGEDDQFYEKDIALKEDGVYYVDPRLPIDDCTDAFDVNIPQGSYDSVGGFITCRKLGASRQRAKSSGFDGAVFR